MIEISLELLGYGLWFVFLGITGWLSYHFMQEKNQNLTHEWIYPMFIFLIILFGGLVLGCHNAWSCPELVRFI